jgi:hypothetical protein
MRTLRFTFFSLVTFTAFLIFSTTTFAQRGRYKYDRGYHHYYPYRSYSYFRPHVSIHFGGDDYWYDRGHFYRPFGSYFQLVVPPFGLRIGTLPYGYRSFYIGPNPYYYYNGIYYRPYANEYEVVAPPLGAVVDQLPPGARPKVIDGQKYYELNGTYYQEQLDAQNRLSYTVVGTDGVLNTDKDANFSPEPQIGDRIDKLPADSKTVVIHGEKLYSTPSGLYYKEVIEGNKVYYELVGK